jgi:hypothetical protein
MGKTASEDTAVDLHEKIQLLFFWPETHIEVF